MHFYTWSRRQLLSVPFDNLFEDIIFRRPGDFAQFRHSVQPHDAMFSQPVAEFLSGHAQQRAILELGKHLCLAVPLLAPVEDGKDAHTALQASLRSVPATLLQSFHQHGIVGAVLVAVLDLPNPAPSRAADVIAVKAWRSAFEALAKEIPVVPKLGASCAPQDALFLRFARFCSTSWMRLSSGRSAMAASVAAW